MCCAISSCVISSGFALTPLCRADEQASAATAAALVNTLATTRSRFPTRAGDIDASSADLVANAGPRDRAPGRTTWVGADSAETAVTYPSKIKDDAHSAQGPDDAQLRCSSSVAVTGKWSEGKRPFSLVCT